MNSIKFLVDNGFKVIGRKKPAMKKLKREQIQRYRLKTYRIQPWDQIKNLEQAINFVKKRGFIFFWPIQGVELPSLWTAVAGNRPVASAHDDPGHVTWGWKDSSLGTNNWYYGKILRRKGTLIAFDIIPFFYALSENFGDPTEDIRMLYYEGRITQEAKIIFEALLEEGPLDTISLRRKTHMTNKENNSKFDRAIAMLQSDFKILPIGISDAGGWHYAFIFDLVHRYYPQLPIIARKIKEEEARLKLTELFFLSVGASRPRDVSKLFSWNKDQTEFAVGKLVERGFLVPFYWDDNMNEDGLAIKNLCDFK